MRPAGRSLAMPDIDIERICKFVMIGFHTNNNLLMGKGISRYKLNLYFLLWEYFNVQNSLAHFLQVRLSLCLNISKQSQTGKCRQSLKPMQKSWRQTTKVVVLDMQFFKTSFTPPAPLPAYLVPVLLLHPLLLLKGYFQISKSTMPQSWYWFNTGLRILHWWKKGQILVSFYPETKISENRT